LFILDPLLFLICFGFWKRRSQHLHLHSILKTFEKSTVITYILVIHIHFTMTIKHLSKCILKELMNEIEKNTYFQSICLRPAFRLKNTLHEWHDTAPIYGYRARTPHLLHSLGTVVDCRFDVFEVDFSITTTGFLSDLENKWIILVGWSFQWLRCLLENKTKWVVRITSFVTFRHRFSIN
jgi:hypothetical protein